MRTITTECRNGARRSLERHGIVVPALPKACPLSLDELLNPEFDPDRAVREISAAIPSGKG